MCGVLLRTPLFSQIHGQSVVVYRHKRLGPTPPRLRHPLLRQLPSQDPKLGLGMMDQDGRKEEDNQNLQGVNLGDLIST